MGHLELGPKPERAPHFPPPHYHPTRKRPNICLVQSRVQVRDGKSLGSSRSQRALKKRTVARKQLEHGNRHVAEKVKSIAKGDHKNCEWMQSSNAAVKSSPRRLPQGISESDSLKIVEPCLSWFPSKVGEDAVAGLLVLGLAHLRGGAAGSCLSRGVAPRGGIGGWGSGRCAGLGVRGSVCGWRTSPSVSSVRSASSLSRAG